MELTEENMDGFLAALKDKLTRELRAGAPVRVTSLDHYPEPRMVEIKGRTFPYPAIGETISILVGFRPEELEGE